MLVASEHRAEMTAAGANGVNVADKNSTWEETGSSPLNAAATIWLLGHRSAEEKLWGLFQ